MGGLHGGGNEAHFSFSDLIQQRRYAGIIQVVDDVFATYGRQAFIEKVTDTLAEISSADCATLYLLSEDGGYLIEQTNRLATSDFSSIAKLTGRSSLFFVHQVIRLDFRNPHPEDVMPDIEHSGGFSCGICVPIRAGESCLGMYNLLYNDARMWNGAEIEYLMVLGELIGLILRRLNESSTLALASELRNCRVLSMAVKSDLASLFEAVRAEGARTISALRRLEGVPSEGALLSGRVPAAVASGESVYLTNREIQIASYVAQGLSNREIGEQLGVSEHTVKNQFAELLRKTKLRNRAQVAAFAVRMGYAE